MTRVELKKATARLSEYAEKAGKDAIIVASGAKPSPLSSPFTTPTKRLPL
jgi:hypothetical protein